MDGRGFIHHIRSVNALGMSEADDVFLQYQQQASTGQLKFRRWPMRAVSDIYIYYFVLTLTVIGSINVSMLHDVPTQGIHHSLPLGRGALLTNYFSHNGTQ